MSLDPQQMMHAKTLQRSQYLVVEDDLGKLDDLAKFDNPEEKSDEPVLGGKKLGVKTKPVSGNFFISFSHEREVQKKREMFLLWQKTFLCKHEHIKDIGQRMLTLRKLEAFIDEHLDELYENRNKNVINLLFDCSLDSIEIAKNPEYH